MAWLMHMMVYLNLEHRDTSIPRPTGHAMRHAAASSLACLPRHHMTVPHSLAFYRYQYIIGSFRLVHALSAMRYSIIIMITISDSQYMETSLVHHWCPWNSGQRYSYTFIAYVN